MHVLPMKTTRRAIRTRLVPLLVTMLIGTRVLAGQGGGIGVTVLIHGGMVIDGTGTAARRADVGIRDDRIVFVGDADRAGIRGARTIEAAGLIVSPGFIDPHTHTAGDLSSATAKGNLAYLMQGVTTVVTNNDG